MRLTIIICLFIAGIFSQDAAEIKKKIQESGLSESQIREMAKQRGMSEAEIDAKAKELKGETSGPKPTTPVIETVPEQKLDDVSMQITSPEETVAAQQLEIESESQPGKIPLPYFGYDIFKQDPELFQASVFGAVDPDYNIGPGDEIIIMLWGETQFRQVLTVDREGFIFIPEVGQVFVNGLTMDAMETKLFKVLSQRYSSLIRSNSGNPSTFLDVSLGNLRPLRILVVGEVAQPGGYRVSPSATLFSSLYYFNGPTTMGSLRNVQLIRSGKQIATIDFYDYLLTGKKPNDARLQLDDTIFLPRRGKTVSIQGEINRPAIYELKDGEGLLDLIRLAGDLKSSAYHDRVQIDRIVPVNDRESLNMDRMYIDVNLKEFMDTHVNFDLLDGDAIQVFPVMDLRKNYVEIRGNVERPGIYELNDKMYISNLVKLADGVINDAYLDLAHLVRINEDLTQDMFKINLGRALTNDPVADLVLQPFDILYVYNKNLVFNAFKTVEVQGAVKRPGSYPHFEGMSVEDLIIQAGGIKNNVYQFKVEIMRVDPNNTSEEKFGNLISLPSLFNIDNFGKDFDNNEIGELQAHDVLFIREDSNLKLNQRVTVTGDVMFPGTYAIKETGELLSSLIKRAGGLTENAFPESSILNRGGVEINLSFKDALDKPGSKYDFIVQNGDEIIINVHPNTVAVYGAVNNPGVFKYYHGYSTRDYIELAGGFTDNANKNDVWIRFPSGDAKEFNRFEIFSPRVQDGSIITVARSEEEKVDRTELAKEITAILANLAQVIAIIILAQP